VGFWYKALGLNIPRGVMMNGGNYLSPDMQVPTPWMFPWISMRTCCLPGIAVSGIATLLRRTIICWVIKGTIFRQRYKAEYIPEDRPRGLGGEAPESKILNANPKSDGTH